MHFIIAAGKGKFFNLQPILRELLKNDYSFSHAAQLSSVVALCVCVCVCKCSSRIIIKIGSKKWLKHTYINYIVSDSLRVEHARADDELEDILQGFEGTEDGLTLFPSTGHVQISLQHWHQLSGRQWHKRDIWSILIESERKKIEKEKQSKKTKPFSQSFLFHMLGSSSRIRFLPQQQSEDERTREEMWGRKRWQNSISHLNRCSFHAAHRLFHLLSDEGWKKNPYSTHVHPKGNFRHTHKYSGVSKQSGEKWVANGSA